MSDEKKPEATHSDRDSIEKVEVAHVKSDDSEEVYDFAGESSLPPPPKLTPEQERKLYRKIDLRIMPIVTLMYLFSFLDRGNIGNAKLQGLTTELNLTGNKYNIALTMYFIPYCLVECPANLLVKRLRPSRWLPAITVAWGIIMTCMGIVQNYPQLVVLRVLLGMAEAGFFPGVVLCLTFWYPRHMLQFRVGLFWGGATVAGAFSGLLAFGISFMSGRHGLLGWSWIFIIEGIATVAVGILGFFLLVDFPATASFLTPEERSYIIWRKKFDNSTVGEEEHFALKHVWKAFSDWQIWVHILIYMSIIGPLYSISFFLPSIINGFGFSTAISQLLTVPPYVCATIVTIIFAIWSDRVQKRSPFILASLTMCLIGFSINVSRAPIGVKYFGTFFCVTGSYAAFPGVISWLGNNMAGQYKRATGIALHIGIGNLAGAIASNTYRSQDAPRYIIGHAIALMFVGIGLTAVPLAVTLYIRTNAKREAHLQHLRETGTKYSVKELLQMGDRAPDFRYTL
ncbi:unnamed protein product [Somion occarium]|uniref:Major facilitator superfamily (MFS) profile domain-containing protein n=1 Tax=Somion occarium TaxID=3059160 RepID=A0ABP1E756_9APHY